MYMPTVWVSRAYLDKVLAQISDSKAFYADLRSVIEEMHGPPPDYKGLDSDSLTL